MNKVFSHLLLILGLVGSLSGCSAHNPTRTETNRNETPDVQAASSSARATSAIGFASRERLAEHYHKHGSEFGDISMQEYLQVAQTLRDRATGATILEAVRSDGVRTRFDRDTGTFIAFNRDGIIRTCFKPNDGEAYFRRQINRRD